MTAPSDDRRPRFRQGAILVVLGLLLTATACARTTGEAATEPQPRAQLIVDNQNWFDVTVYAVRGGVRARVGFVTGLSRARFAMPVALGPASLDVAFVAHAIGSGEFIGLGSVPVDPGQIIRLRLASDLRHSAVSVY